ncbi:MAG: M20/M25/M40 family metallo-hydrolase [Acidobacteriota bacterium]
MVNRSVRSALALCLSVVALVSVYALVAEQDPVVQRIIQMGTADNQAMRWADIMTNRFGGRVTGSDAYTNAAQWALWQFTQWGLEAELDEVGEVPVGFNRGPWFGKMVKPAEKTLYFGTPTFTAGTKGVQRGGVAMLRTDPYSIPGRNASAENVEKKRVAVDAAIAEITASPATFKDKWVLIAGDSTGFGRDGRRNTPEYADATLMPPLTQALVTAGALGTIQRMKAPYNILDGYATAWDKLPVLPDIKLLDTQYDEIRALAEKGDAVELEFDIRNWFKMGPVKYHNIVATLRGTTYPDEHIIIGSHFDSFDAGTGAVDDGSGSSPHIEAMRLIAQSGARPKRSITIILFAAEENGLVGSQSWLRKRPDVQPKIVAMINRDGSPSAITGATVPGGWYAAMEPIVAPLANLNPTWPFRLARNDYPSARPERPGGTDSSSFAMAGIPTLNFTVTREYTYSRAWHTLNDLYSELVPFTKHQQHSALVTAVVAYGVANLETPLTRAGVYLDDGIYADLTTASGTRIMASLDYVNAPLQTANFIRIAEGSTPQAGGGRGGPPPGMGGQGRGGAGPDVPPIGTILDVKGGVVSANIVSDVQKSVAMPRLPGRSNPALKHDGPGVLGVSGPNAFYLTLQRNTGLDRKYTAIGRVIAGEDLLRTFKKGDRIRSVRIIRAGQVARGFRTDNEAFAKLMQETSKTR